jgi:protein-histidine pros-kinase
LADASRYRLEPGSEPAGIPDESIAEAFDRTTAATRDGGRERPSPDGQNSERPATAERGRAATVDGRRPELEGDRSYDGPDDPAVVNDGATRGFGMNLLSKFSLLILAVLSIGLLAGGKIWHDVLQSDARQQVLGQAQLMIKSATAMRTYTEKQIQPVVGVRRDSEFHPQWVPFYAATQIFKYISADYPDYTYKEAALNPMNQRDRAVDWEADIINYFRDNPGKTELTGERNSATGRSMYYAHPIVAEAGCLECHSSVAAAPPKMVSFYGTSNGFGWKLNEVVGAQIVSVPMSVPLGIADTSFRAWLSSVAGLALLTLVTLGIALTFWVSRPLSRVADAAAEIGQGNARAAQLSARGEDEIAHLEKAFNRMQRRLFKRGLAG